MQSLWRKIRLILEYPHISQSILIELYNFRTAQYVAKNPMVPVGHDMVGSGEAIKERCKPND
jgi:hypothetical protein